MLNFVPLDVSGENFLSYVSGYESKESLVKLRKKYHTCVFSRRGSEVFCVPYSDGEHFGDEREVHVLNDQNLVCKLILDNLQRNLISNGRKIVKLNPLSFIDTNRDLIKESSYNEKLQGFHIYPRFTLDVKPIKNRDNTITFGILIDVSAYFDISLSVKAFADRNISLDNMYLDVKSSSKIKDNDWIHRNMIGRLDSIEGETVNLSDYKEKANISSSECFPEPRKDNFNYLLRSVLGSDYLKLKSELQEKLYEFVGGNGKVQLTIHVIDEIKKITDKKISNELSFSPHDELLSIGEQSTVGYAHVQQPTYVYDLAKTKTHNWHNGGLNSFGPFDLESFHRKNPRVVVITPKNYQGEVEKFLNSFKNGIPGKGYYQQGFVRKYHLNDMTFDFVTFDSDLTDVAKRYRETCLSVLEGEPYDLAFVLQKKYSAKPEYEKIFKGSNPDLFCNSTHIEVKTILSSMIDDEKPLNKNDPLAELYQKSFISFERHFKKAIRQIHNDGMIIAGFWSKRINNELKEYFSDRIVNDLPDIQKGTTVLVIEGNKPLEEHYVCLPTNQVLELMKNYCDHGRKLVNPMAYMTTMMRNGFPKQTSNCDGFMMFRMG